MAWVNVDVELTEFSDSELKAEMISRGFQVFEDGKDEYERDSEFQTLYELLALGKKDEALEMVRTMVQDHTGRVL